MILLLDIIQYDHKPLDNPAKKLSVKASEKKGVFYL